MNEAIHSGRDAVLSGNKMITIGPEADNCRDRTFQKSGTDADAAVVLMVLGETACGGQPSRVRESSAPGHHRRYRAVLERHESGLRLYWARCKRARDCAESSMGSAWRCTIFHSPFSRRKIVVCGARTTSGRTLPPTRSCGLRREADFECSGHAHVAERERGGRTAGGQRHPDEGEVRSDLRAGQRHFAQSRLPPIITALRSISPSAVNPAQNETSRVTLRPLAARSHRADMLAIAVEAQPDAIVLHFASLHTTEIDEAINDRFRRFTHPAPRQSQPLTVLSENHWPTVQGVTVDTPGTTRIILQVDDPTVVKGAASLGAVFAVLDAVQPERPSRVGDQNQLTVPGTA
ncbi:hypothetical protein [Amycolatopsis sp. NPDC051128]|uniref:hypothetical protein n=1 Tax=Amycolatopsis sp. NPDC051128 TaxID=3155412 RepID=UPI00344441EB